MHIPSERVYNEMNSEPAFIWFVPANQGEELAFLIKVPTPSIKALISGCSMQLIFGRQGAFLSIGVRIWDIPDSPVVISRIQRDLEEHCSLIRALQEKEFPVFLFNEMDICLAWSNIKLIEDESKKVLDVIGQEPEAFYVGKFTKEASFSLDCFDYSIDARNTHPNSVVIPTKEISVAFDQWQSIKNYFLGNREHHSVIINEKDEGGTFEQAIWASLTSVFPLDLYKSPQVLIGEKIRELTDVLTVYNYGSFLIEAKDLSVLSAGFSRDEARRLTGIQKQVKKAINQLIGASKAFTNEASIYTVDGEKLRIDRRQPPHCIILITELMFSGDWSEIANHLLEAMKEKGSFFHLLDFREFMTLLKGSSGKAELFDYNLIKRCELFVEKKSVLIQSKPS